MKSRYKSRKFIAAVVVMLLASIFLTIGKLGGAEWITAVNISLGLYVGSNVVQKRGDKSGKD
ncbi:hypothetical protein [Halocella sp. SP3-1]|uniref:hypothetical protein n=1 Tax=Halocella sp. SP3-1 TaxID=2382161 RepID=UPI000F74C051|nr:hypothetical protein [Halocella sp. SP3-1]AZO95292.1 hypothetical protein D7D81_12195 [Halocella sp. SP3-1]